MKELFGLIGYPLSHSFSAKYFNEKFEKDNIDAEYRLFPIENISELRRLLENKNIKGLNVTIPYKESVIPFLNYISPEAEEIGAVNVVRIDRDKNGNAFLSGYNTDYMGFKSSFKPLICEKEKCALILGTGGASKAVEYALNTLGFHAIKVSRNPQSEQFSYQDLKQYIHTIFYIINTTPLGTFPDTEGLPPLPYALLTPEHICYDLVYNPSVTRFLKTASEYGATLKNGLEMLYKQAEEAWKIWNK